MNDFAEDLPEKDPLEGWIDKWGFVIHKDKWGGKPYDAGDGAQRTFGLYIQKWIEEPHMRFLHAKTVERMLTLIKKPNGEYVRHPDVKYWWGQAGCMSWDNLITAIICMSLYQEFSDELKSLKRKLFWRLILRLGFVWNIYPLDPTPEEKEKPKIPGNALLRPWTWTAFFRGAHWIFAPITYPTLLALDTLFILTTIGRLLTSYFIPKKCPGNNLNYQWLLIHGQVQWWSPIIYVYRLIYSLLLANPIDPKTEKRAVGYAPYNMWRVYFWDEDFHPPYYKITYPLMDKYV